ncbi:N-acetyldiaminopimelate deacetylase [Melghirimyces thermohalophilus]|uniref:N-acetyldiaminopimelate deacetylase n=1 Tax=Melghirimyces thermohalophilus TaxID=1236220 RepID=A0A1G6KBW9_9BACL|nr:N-acetyldiaminopimelate deacetylase [Melghirimyces thermohalophilus]SDC28453.1 N-acetyldiaminopimelate deacetylase [Melghirimyces thermohalophilus]
MGSSLSSYVDIRRDLHRIPELGFAEFKTQKYLLDYLSRLPQDRLEIKTWRTGVLVKVKGTQPTRILGYRTDIDGLPIHEETEYEFRSEHPGQMHACGHDFHMAIALGILTHFVNHPVRDDLLFIFQPAEEGPGGALPMLKSEEFQQWRPEVLFGLHIGPDYPVGTIATRPGILFANTSELYIDLVGTDGHASLPHRANDMVIAASQLAMQLQTIISRNIDPLDSAILTLGKVTIGTKQNIIPGNARLEGTIRTLSMESMERIKKRIRALVRGIEEGFACEAHIDWGANYCQVENEKNLTREFIDWARRETDVQVVECREAMAGEDFGYFLREIPGWMFWLGVDSPHGLHHPQIDPKEEAIPVAIDLMIRWLTWKANP